MMPGKVVTAEEAVRAINSGDTITISGVVGSLVPEKVLASLEERFLKEGEPRNLTVFCPVAVGDVFDLPGMDHLAHEGMTRRFIAGSYVIGTSPKTGQTAAVTRMILENKVEAYNLPLGVLQHLLREIAAGRPGVITKAGLGTFVDPRLEGGKMNALTTEDLVELVNLGGEEYLWYKSFPVHVAIIRGTTADEDGNITMEHEGTVAAALAQAMAAHNAGGKVIAQVKRLAARGSLHPQMVKIPGVLVDYIVVDPYQVQATGVAFDPSVCGEVRAPLAALRRDVPFDAEKVIARRALLELQQGETVILGFGAPSLLPSIALEEGIADRFHFTVEHGSIGGIPLAGFQFGVNANPAAIIDSPSHFDYINGGGFDVACLAFAEVDPHGSVNVSKLPKLIPGCGGFIEITHRSRHIVFCGFFTASGLKVTVADGRLHIVQEGRHVKFVQRLFQTTFDGKQARRKGQRVSFITERGVFELRDSGLVLTEVAPGIDIERDIAGRMQFPLQVSPDLREMDARLFRPEPMGLIPQSAPLLESTVGA